MIAQYGTEQAPPPWQIFTIPNNIKEGNMHFVQKVFEGAFEVRALVIIAVKALKVRLVRHSVLFSLCKETCYQ